MDIKKGRRKAFDIEFVDDINEENIKEVAEWCGGVVGGEGRDRFIKIIDKGAINPMQTKAFIGDIIVHHLELKTFKKFGRKSFNKSYVEIVDEGSNRDAESGQFVTEEYAGEHPSTTVKEQIEHTRKIDTAELPEDASLGERA